MYRGVLYFRCAVLTVRVVGHEERREQQGDQSSGAVYPGERARRGVIPPTQGLLVHLIHTIFYCSEWKVGTVRYGMVRYGTVWYGTVRYGG